MDLLLSNARALTMREGAPPAEDGPARGGKAAGAAKAAPAAKRKPQEKQKAKPQPEAQAAPAVKYCHQCGHGNPASNRFCNACRYAFPA